MLGGGGGVNTWKPTNYASGGDNSIIYSDAKSGSVLLTSTSTDTGLFFF